MCIKSVDGVLYLCGPPYFNCKGLKHNGEETNLMSMGQVWKLKVLSVPDIDVIIKANINRFDTGLPFNTKKLNF